jgi:hypothetical protein
MEQIVERPGALDVHKASVTACVRVWKERVLEEHVAEFATTVQGLLALRDWLEALGVTQVAMEATGGVDPASWTLERLGRKARAGRMSTCHEPDLRIRRSSAARRSS